MKHWTQDEFLNWIYAGEGDAKHLEECHDCRAQADQMSETRRTAIATPEVSWEFLAAQRRSIYQRLEKGSGMAGRWSVAFASLICIVALSLTLMRPWAGSDRALYTSSDAKLFSDLASIEQSSEPRAIRAIHNLFEE
jgi:predicted anti-sigma-YlaC factor YlaD